MEMETLGEENDYLLCDSNTWVPERELTISYLHILERYLTSNLQVEVIKLEEMDQATNENTNILTTVDIVNEKRISSAPILKQNDDISQYYGKMDCKQEELANSLENCFGSDKGAQISHRHEKPFTCDICEKVFKERRELSRHKLIHDGGKPYACDTCQKTFKYRSNLNTHKVIHSDEKPYTCHICAKAFKHTGHLREHKITHSGEKPYTCDMCEKNFNDVVI